ncbi:hypothetical protein C1I97_27465 [Streptomyces sp. NTH33]|uniref:hypothetical protein n=1 Tax=Streptomyces sp. NTH33 TaxID=1735453 RepID=UPI000DA6EF74|nr:hypothetical protein [Streptomyces sp. NTH33]PZG94800.1 hypothetical protein C1I97_27465 [Streptomyces sp. NTH33]
MAFVRMLGGVFALIGAGLLAQGALKLGPSGGVEWESLPRTGLPTCLVLTSLVMMSAVLQWRRRNPGLLRTAWSAEVVQRVAAALVTLAPPLLIVAWWALGPGPLSAAPGLVAASLVLFPGQERPDEHDDPLGDPGTL